MKSLSLIKPALFLLLLTAAYALPVKAQQTKNVAVSNFSEVAVSAGIELIITQGSIENAKIVANEGIIDEVLIEKQGSKLRIGWRDNFSFRNNFKNKSAKVYVNYKSLNSISASSGSSLVTENLLKTNKLEVTASSGGTVKAKISCSDLDLSTSSGGSAAISGKAVNMDVSSSSGGNIDATDLISDYAKARASSGGNIEINVSKGLEASTGSGGNIRYKGSAPLHVTSKNTGIRHID